MEGELLSISILGVFDGHWATRSSLVGMKGLMFSNIIFHNKQSGWSAACFLCVFGASEKSHCKSDLRP